MSDLIWLHDAVNVADMADYTGLSVEDVKKVTDEVVKGLKALPTIDAVPVVHGHWDVHEDTYGDDEAKCSVCGFEMAVNQPGNGLYMVSELNYCPHCGAQMDESTQSNDSNTLDALGEKVTE